MKLLTSQKDTVYESIEKAGLSPSQFEMTEATSTIAAGQIVTKLVFKNSEYYFSFETGPNSSTKHYTIMCPGQDVYTESAYPGDWELQIGYFKRWLPNLLRELNAPNKWNRLSKEIAGINIKFENDEDKFSVHEFEDLKQKIISLKQGITSITLLPEQITAINTKLDQLTDLAKNMNKFDWKSLFIGTIVSIIIQLSVTQENASLLWAMIKQVFNNYLLP